MLTLSKLTRGYARLATSWFANPNPGETDVTDEVVLGLYSTKPGITGLLTVTWRRGPTGLRSSLSALGCDWGSLRAFEDVLAEMSEVGAYALPPELFCQMLVRHGFEDRTFTKRD